MTACQAEPSPISGETYDHLSYSQLSTYLKCSLQYAFRYIHKLPTPIDGNRLIGQAVHRGVEHFYQQVQAGKAKEDIPLEELVKACSNHVEISLEYDEVDLGDSTAKEVVESGNRLLKVFHASVKPKTVVGVEEAFELQLEGLPKLIGFIDLIECDDEGSWAVVDLKTSATDWSDLQVGLDLQLSIYALAVEAVYGKCAEDLTLRVDALVKTKTPKFSQKTTSRTQRQLDWTRSLIRSVADAIEAERFHPSPSVMNCAKCSFRKQCSQWRG